MSEEQASTGARAGQTGDRRGLRNISAIVLMVVYQLPLAGYLIPGESLTANIGREGLYWFLTLLLIAYIVFFERRPLASVGWRWPTWRTWTYGVGAAVVMVGGMAAIYLGLLPALGLAANDAGLAKLTALPLWFRAMLVLRAGVFEELYFRGFMIERLSELTGVRALAAVISLAAFTLAHLSYWGWAHLIVVAFGGGLLTGLYLFKRDLSSNMIAHTLTDTIGLLLG